MTFNINDWKRYDCEGIPVYFNSKEPDWFVPNSAGDRLLKDIAQGKNIENDFFTQRFIKRLPQMISSPYAGRSDCLVPGALKELWFHITNRCNMNCSHCLFSSSPATTGELSAEYVLGIAKEAHETGCRVFALTGGEPFCHEDIARIIDGLLRFKNSHVVILTNGMTLMEKLYVPGVDTERFHLQVSVDGLDERHDVIRGKGAFVKLTENLEWLKSNHTSFTISMTVTRENMTDMPKLVDFAASTGAVNVHFIWYFIRGRGQGDWFAPSDDIYPWLIKAAERAKETGISVDNIEAFKSRIFVPRGTIHDGTTSGWESLAIGPDGMAYPSPALTGIPELASDMSEGLVSCLKNSSIIKKIRELTIAKLDSDLRFFTGGGDMDHSYMSSKTFMGDDPYEVLYRKMMMWLIANEASQQSDDSHSAMRARMGEILESCGAHGKVALIHSNCLLAAAGENSLSTVKSFYTEAADKRNSDIINPVSYDDELMEHIPEHFRFRGYGCGSPVLDADIQEGELVLDLGSGSGVECFIAAKITGPSGSVTGVDMLDPMLARAEKGLEGVEKNLGYKNLLFKKGYLEDLPLENDSIDVVISNCVMNLSVNKRKAYSEILRVLKPGGRLVISDVVCETDPDPVIRNDETLRGECIAGAFTQQNLAAILEETGFESIMFHKRFPYRKVMDHQFYSLTYSAVKPYNNADMKKAIYRGPASGITLKDGITVFTGEVVEIPDYTALRMEGNFFLPDDAGNITNIDAENYCDCCTAPENSAPVLTNILQGIQSEFPGQKAGCMVCGEPMAYFTAERNHECSYCGKIFSVNALCEQGHFVCDACHGKDGFKVLGNILMNTKETDMLRLLEQIHSHPSIPVHGPEHHAMVPGIIVASYYNLGGNIEKSDVNTAIKRGSSIAGGHCGFMGICGAAVGAGTAFSIILDGNPLKGDVRQLSQIVTGKVLAEITKYNGARCCQRDSWIALKKVGELSKEYLHVPLKADYEMNCRQKHLNKECLGKICPMF